MREVLKFDLFAGRDSELAAQAGESRSPTEAEPDLLTEREAPSFRRLDSQRIVT